MQRMRQYRLERAMITKNQLLEDVKTWKRVGTIMAAVSVSTGSAVEANQILRISSTHRAITPDAVQTGDRFGGYVVDYVIPGRTYNQLFLSREDAVYESSV